MRRTTQALVGLALVGLLLGATPAWAELSQGAQEGITRAIEDLTKVIAQNPDLAYVYFHRSLLYNELGRCPEAQADFAQVQRLDPRYRLPACSSVGETCQLPCKPSQAPSMKEPPAPPSDQTPASPR